MHFSQTLLLALPAAAVTVEYYLGPSCTGEELGGASYTKPTGCIQIPNENEQSIIAAFQGSADNNLQIELFTNSKCSGKPAETQIAPTICIADESEQYKAFKITKKGKKREIQGRDPQITKRSPQEIASAVSAMVARAEADEGGADVFERALAESDSGKKYDLSGMTLYNGSSEYNGSTALGPHEDVRTDHPFLAALTHGGITAVSFSALVTGCVGVGSASPVNAYGCAASIAVTSLSFISTLYHVYKGYKNIQATLRNNNIELGVRRPRNKRSLADEKMVVSHEEYMEYILHLVGYDGSHLGYHQRYEDMGFSTPAYHFGGEDGQNYVYTISPDENGHVKHSISFAHDTKIHTRQGYKGVTVKGGLDVEACQQNSRANYGSLPSSASTAYSYFIQDFKCLVSSSELLNNNYASADVMDTSGNVIYTVGMSPFKTGTANRETTYPPCDQSQFHMDQSCIY